MPPREVVSLLCPPIEPCDRQSDDPSGFGAEHRTGGTPLQGTPRAAPDATAPPPSQARGSGAPRRALGSVDQLPKMSSLRSTIPLGQHLKVPALAGLTRTYSPFFTCMVTLQLEIVRPARSIGANMPSASNLLI